MKKDTKGNQKSKQQSGNGEGASQRGAKLASQASTDPGSKKRKRVRVTQVTGAPPLAGLPERTVGIDLGNKYCHWYRLDREGNEVDSGRVATDELGGFLQQLAASRVVMETGMFAHWASRQAVESGHEVYVANSRHLRSIYENPNKSDAYDAEMLARLGRMDLSVLHPVELRGAQMQVDISVLRARDQVVQARSKLIAAARNLVKGFGCRLPACDAAYFHRHAAGKVPQELRPVIDPLIRAVARLTATIQAYDKRLEKLARQRYPEIALFEQVKGVGTLTALGYRLTLAEANRFGNSRDVGPYLGLTRKRDQSGEDDPELGITKAGNGYLRRLLVGSAHYILGPFGPDTDLRRFGLRLMGETDPSRRHKKPSKGRKKRAVVAVARKLAVLLHALWTSGEVYEPLRNSPAAATSCTS